MTAAQIVEKQFEHLEEYIGSFGYDIQLVQSEIFDLLISLVEALPQKNGKFLYEDSIKKEILKFEAKIQELFTKGNYSKAYNSIFPNLDELDTLQREMSAFIQPDLRDKIFKASTSNVKKGFINKIASSIGSKNALGVNIIGPLKSILYENAVMGLTIQETKKRLFDIAITSPQGGILDRYVGQVARDSLFQFTGSVDKAIGDYIGAKDANYLGNLIRDSRPQCIRWIEQFNGFIPGDKLKAELAYVRSRPKEFPGYSKYLPKLTVESFPTIKGGHNCRHRVVMTVGTSKEIRARIDKVEGALKDKNDDFEKKAAANLTGKKNLRRVK